MSKRKKSELVFCLFAPLISKWFIGLNDKMFTLTIVSMATVESMIGILCFLNNVKYMSSWKKEKPFANTDFKPFTQ